MRFIEKEFRFSEKEFRNFTLGLRLKVLIVEKRSKKLKKNKRM
jgi:hypothetical protein